MRLLSLICSILYLTSSINAQFKAVAGGFASSSKAAITTIAGAGGGVVLKGKAVLPEDLNISQIILYDSSNQIEFLTNQGTFNFLGSSWMFRDAAMHVYWESMQDSMYRNINLLGSPESVDEYLEYSPDEYWYVEVTDSLIGTKSGEILLLADIIQTDISFYSDRNDFVLDSLSYYLTMEKLNIKDIQSSYELNSDYDYYDLYYDLSPLDSFRYTEIKYLSAEEISNGMTVEDGLISIMYNMFSHIRTLHRNSNWTYNDEFTEYKVDFDSINEELIILGEPNFTFLTSQYINEIYTNHFQKFPKLISNLNNQVFSQAVEFGRITALFRYLEKNETHIWDELFGHYKFQKKVDGNTPRIIKK